MQKKIYFCTIDWQHEVGEIWAKAYASIDELKAQHECWATCGITEVDLTNAATKTIEAQDLRFDTACSDKEDLIRMAALLEEIAQISIAEPVAGSALDKRRAWLRLEQSHLQKHLDNHLEAAHVDQ